MTGRIFLKSLLLTTVCGAAFSTGCAVAAKNNGASPPEVKTSAREKNSAAPNAGKDSPSKKGITFAADSPAETIRVFYKNLREKKFREAIMMTNLHAAVENLSDAEALDLSPDFEALAAQIPAELQISGEIITENKATVTVKLPDEETGVLEDKIFNLQRESGAWVYLMADAATETAAKREGKNYFFNLRLEVHHAEAKSMIERIAKAEIAYFVQNGSVYADLPALVAQKLLPADAQTADSTGYRYGVATSSDKKKYTATAEPAVYGKTGKLSYFLQTDDKGKNSGIKSKDNKGMPMKN